MSLYICNKHECCTDGGPCEACNLQEQLTEAQNDLQATRHELIEQERKTETAERNLALAQEEINRLESRISSLEADAGM